jgi:hypothetical protein
LHNAENAAQDSVEAPAGSAKTSSAVKLGGGSGPTKEYCKAAPKYNQGCCSKKGRSRKISGLDRVIDLGLNLGLIREHTDNRVRKNTEFSLVREFTAVFNQKSSKAVWRVSAFKTPSF